MRKSEAYAIVNKAWAEFLYEVERAGLNADKLERHMDNRRVFTLTEECIELMIEEGSICMSYN